MEIQTAVAQGNERAAVAGEQAKKDTAMEIGKWDLLKIEAQKKADLEVMREKHTLDRLFPTQAT